MLWKKCWLRGTRSWEAGGGGGGQEEILNRMVSIVIIEKIVDTDVRLEGHVDIWRKSILGRWKRELNGRSFLLCFRMSMKAVCLFYKTVQVYKSNQNNCWDECQDPEVRYFFYYIMIFFYLGKEPNSWTYNKST